MANLKLKVQARELPARLLNPVEAYPFSSLVQEHGKESPADKGSCI